MTANAFGAPIPLSEMESVLAWVDTFKLSRATKKINRDFADAVLLAEILANHYPKLVEMHNYPPRNSHALKLNNWMTLNRKVLKKLKLNLCCNTMEQLANSTPGVIERVLVMVRDKIKRDEELERSTREAETNMSSGGSYYEACGEEDHVLVVPVKTRVNGVLETIQQKVVSYDAYVTLKAELKDAQDTSDILKQKVEHLDSLIKLKDERITELQKQLERKQLRRGKEPETIPNSLSVPFDEILSPIPDNTIIPVTNKSSGTYNLTNPSITIVENPDNTKIPTPKTSNTKINLQGITKSQSQELIKETVSKISKPIPTEPSITEVTCKDAENINKDQINTDLISDVERVKSDVFKEANAEGDELEFKDSEQGNMVTIEETIQKEIFDIRKA